MVFSCWDLVDFGNDPSEKWPQMGRFDSCRYLDIYFLLCVISSQVCGASEGSIIGQFHFFFLKL